MRDCMKLKAEHNLRKMGLLKDPVFQALPTGPAPWRESVLV
jgi:hypothetical protein